MSTHKASAVVIGGKFRFKGDGNKKSIKRPRDVLATSYVAASSSSSSSALPTEQLEEDILLTDAQKRHKQKKKEMEKDEVAAAVAVSYRERINKFNYQLSTTTEHNDVPRVSAAGNG